MEKGEETITFQMWAPALCINSLHHILKKFGLYKTLISS